MVPVPVRACASPMHGDYTQSTRAHINTCMFCHHDPQRCASWTMTALPAFFAQVISSAQNTILGTALPTRAALVTPVRAQGMELKERSSTDSHINQTQPFSQIAIPATS